MRNKFLILLLVVATGYSVNATARVNDTASVTPAAGEKMVLSLNEAQKYAIEHNKTLANAEIDVQKAEKARWQALATMLPQVSATFDYSNMCGYELNFGAMAIPMNPSGSLGVTASMTVSGAQVIALQISKISEKMMNVAYLNNEQTICNQVKTYYFSALIMHQTVGLLEKNLENIKNLADQTAKSVKIGVAEQTDADKLMVQVATMQTTISSTKRSLEMVYNAMRLQLGLPVDTEIELSQTLDDLLNVEAALALVSKDFIVDSNYNYQLLKYNTDITKKQVDIAWWNHAPTITAFYQYSYKTYFGKEEGMNMTPPNAIGASINIPIFSSWSRHSKLDEARLAHQAQLNTLDDTRNSLLVQHSQLKYNVSSAYDTYETQKQNLEVNQRIFDKLSEKYEQGLSSSLEVTNSSSNLISAQSSFVQAVMELITAQIELENLLSNNNKE